MGRSCRESRFDVVDVGEYADAMDLDRLQRVQRTGRRLGLAVFAGVVSVFVIVCSAQILYQGFREHKLQTSGKCRAEVSRLVVAVRTARRAAADAVAGERDALLRFRATLEPQWQQRPAIEKLCRGDDWARDAILEIDEWRWTEEIAVRYESAELAPSRRRVQAIEKGLGRPSPSH